MAFLIKVMVKKDYKGLVKNSIHSAYIRSDGILVPVKDKYVLISRNECRILNSHEKVM